jgi:hypothetical protein
MAKTFFSVLSAFASVEADAVVDAAVLHAEDVDQATGKQGHGWLLRRRRRRWT